MLLISLVSGTGSSVLASSTASSRISAGSVSGISARTTGVVFSSRVPFRFQVRITTIPMMPAWTRREPSQGKLILDIPAS